MIDTHAHLDLPHFDEDRAEVVQRAREAGVEAIIMPAISPDGFPKARQLVEEYPELYRAVGIHPHAAADVGPQQLAAVEAEVGCPKVVAIGEIGLDYFYAERALPEQQQRVFREQIRLAKRCGLPIIVHNRNAHADVLRLLEEEQDGTLQGVLHCFSGDAAVLERALALGFHVSFTGNITYRKSAVAELVPLVPEDRLMVETDAPYMTPQPYRGKRNEPAFVRYVVERIAELTGRARERVVADTSRVARALFRLPLLLGAFCLSCLWAQGQQDSASGRHLYAKGLGFGLHGATNTIVELRRFVTGGDQTFSYEGVPAFGLHLFYEFHDYVAAELAYTYSRNTKVLKSPQRPWGQDRPDIYQVLELCAHVSPNPYGRVNFYGTLGGAALFNRINDQPENRVALVTGVGLRFNVLTSFGMLMPWMEWRLDFALGREEREVVLSLTERRRAEVGFYLSLPRVGLLWFPRW
ncbi:D-aminoacyl-tRNA deacylase [bacterium HR21]|nr:D-aminoacyl-tRNA deacylase [bacterium HR21]